MKLNQFCIWKLLFVRFVHSTFFFSVFGYRFSNQHARKMFLTLINKPSFGSYLDLLSIFLCLLLTPHFCFIEAMCVFFPLNICEQMLRAKKSCTNKMHFLVHSDRLGVSRQIGLFEERRCKRNPHITLVTDVLIHDFSSGSLHFEAPFDGWTRTGRWVTIRLFISVRLVSLGFVRITLVKSHGAGIR